MPLYRRNCKLADFSSAVRTTSAKLTAVSANEVHYQAPEMVTGGAYRGAAADAWSLGVIGYYCLCGRLPFVANNPVTLVRRIVRLSCRPLPPHISEGAADLLFGALLVANAAHRSPLVTLLHHRWFDMEAPFVSAHRHPPRIAILPATIKQLAAAGLSPQAVQASVRAKKLDYLYAAYTLVTERCAEAELRGSSASSSMTCSTTCSRPCSTTSASSQSTTTSRGRTGSSVAPPESSSNRAVLPPL